MVCCQGHATDAGSHNTACYYEHRKSHLRLFCAGCKAVWEGNEEELTGSGVGLNSLEELVLEGDVLDTVEVLVLEDRLFKIA